MGTLANLLKGPHGSILEREILPAWLPERRWFRSKSRPIRSVALESVLPLDSGAVFSVLRVAFADNGSGRYALPLALVSPADAAGLPDAAVIGALEAARNGDGAGTLIDACWHAGFRADLLDLLSGKKKAQDGGSVLRGLPASSATPAFAGVNLHGVFGTVSRILSAEQSNTAIVYGEDGNAVFVKLYRRLEAGVHPEPEMLRFLREHTAYRRVPAFLSSLEWTAGDGDVSTAALAQEFVAGGADAWSDMLENLRIPLEEAGRNGSGAEAALPEPLLARVTLLGRRVGELHAALGSRSDAATFADFALEPLVTADVAMARESARKLLEESLGLLEAGNAAMSEETRALARAVLDEGPRLRAMLQGSAFSGDAGSKIRTHGDLHLGQILIEGEDFRILDFEGEPGRPLAAARARQSPLRDVAGMLRSFHYAAHVATRGATRGAARSATTSVAWNPAHPVPDAAADGIARRLGARFLSGYFPAMEGSGLLPTEGAARANLLDLFILEKAVYELHYEWNNRPDWIRIPLRGLLSLRGEWT